MLVEQNLHDGNLKEALAQLQEQVRSDPSNVKHRIFLFQLLSVMGEWNRAMTQLDVAADLDAGTLAMVQTYREALRCEALRAEVFAGKRSPMVFGDPEKWVALTMEALRLSADGSYTQSQELREQAYEDVPAVSGDVDGQGFEWLADADTRIGPFLEAIVNGNYYWIPFHRIHVIHVEEPVDLRDLVWMPAHFTWSNGGEAVGLIPTRYPGSESSEDNMLRMARKTEWLEKESDVYLGLGQRVFATNDQDYSLMDVRKISLNTLQDSTQDQQEETIANMES